VVIFTLPGDVSVFRSRLFSLTFCYPETQDSGGMRRHLTVICTLSFGDPKSDDTQRPMWSFVPFLEMSASSNRNYLVSPFAIQRLESPIACRDTLRLSAPHRPETASPMSLVFAILRLSESLFHPETNESGRMRGQ